MNFNPEGQSLRIIKNEIKQLPRMPSEEVFLQKCEIICVW